MWVPQTMQSSAVAAAGRWYTAADKWIRQRAGVAGRVTAGQTDQADQTHPVGAPEMKAAVGPRRGRRLQSSRTLISGPAAQSPASAHRGSLSLTAHRSGRHRPRPPSTLVLPTPLLWSCGSLWRLRSRFCCRCRQSCLFFLNDFCFCPWQVLFSSNNRSFFFVSNSINKQAVVVHPYQQGVL